MNLAEKALVELFPEKNERRSLHVRYSGRFSDYNANATYTRSEIIFSLSKAFKEVGKEIRQGIIEHLLCKVYAEKRSSSNQDLYNSFMKHLTKYATVDQKDPYLLDRFHVINDHYFNGMLTEPNLKWGQKAYRKLGHYEYASDTIVISSIFLQAQETEKVQDLLDFVLFHEMLHKKHQYNHKKERSRHHTKAFKEDEVKWHDRQVDRKLRVFLSKKRLKKAFFGF